MVLYARWLMLARGQESTTAYSAKRDFEEWITTFRKPGEMAMERRNGQATVRVE